MDGVEKNDTINWQGWETVRLIGRGSFGSVFEVQRTVGGTIEKAAIKKISIPQNEYDIEELYSEGYDEESISRTFDDHLNDILAEYNLMRELRDCVNVVSCDDIKYEKHEDGIGWDIYIRMELLRPLNKYLSEDIDTISDELVEKLAKDICNALQMCQKHNVVHRDIKPQNIFVSENGDFKLGDFGIAKTMEKTTGGTKIGTYKFMAPEVYNNQPYGHSADIYSLGLVLYWVLNERRMPFVPLPPEKPTVSLEEESMKRRLSGELLPEPVHGDKKLKNLVLKACAFHSDERYKSAREILDDIDFAKEVVLDDKKITESNEEQNTKNESSLGESQNTKSKPFIKRFPRGKANISIKKKLIIIVLVMVITLLAYLLYSYGGVALDYLTSNSSYFNTDDSATSKKENDSMASGDYVEDDSNSSAPTEHLYWSEWLDELPKNINKENYDIEERKLYSSRELKLSSSVEKDKMDGWELFDTVDAGDGYGRWSDWSDDAVTGTESRQVESQNFYRYRDKETTTSYSSSINGWTQYDISYYWGNYGTWSAWSTASVSSNDSRKVETKTQYRYRDVSYSTDYTEWGNWSDWSFTRQSTNNLKKEESRNTWGYYYYKCPNCGAHMHGYGNGTCHTWAGGCGANIPRDTWHQFYFPYSWDSAGIKDWYGTGKYYVVIDRQRYFMWSDGGSRTQYRYATRNTKQVKSYGDWSAWGDNAYSSSSTREVQTRTVYRYCTRSQIAVYYFYRWGNWSGWSGEKINASGARQVESKTRYRYRDQIKTKTYYFRKWTDWTEYSTGVVTPSDTVQVNTKTQFRFKLKTPDA